MQGRRTEVVVHAHPRREFRSPTGIPVEVFQHLIWDAEYVKIEGSGLGWTYGAWGPSFL